MTYNGRFLPNTPEVTRNLIIINIIMFAATLLNRPFMYETFALFYPSSPHFHWWQVVTHMFMHGGFWHIFFNMYTLYIFGSVIERIIGRERFLTLYFVCGFGAVGLHLGVEYLQAQSYMAGIAENSSKAIAAYQGLKLTPTLGASGAVYGLLIAYAMLFPQARLTLIFPPVTLSAKAWVITFAVIELFTGITGFQSGVAHFAHLGGMLLGYFLIKYWRKTGNLFPDNNFY